MCLTWKSLSFAEKRKRQRIEDGENRRRVSVPDDYDGDFYTTCTFSDRERQNHWLKQDNEVKYFISVVPNQPGGARDHRKRRVVRLEPLNLYTYFKKKKKCCHVAPFFTRWARSHPDWQAPLFLLLPLCVSWHHCTQIVLTLAELATSESPSSQFSLLILCWTLLTFVPYFAAVSLTCRGVFPTATNCRVIVCSHQIFGAVVKGLLFV